MIVSQLSFYNMLVKMMVDTRYVTKIALAVNTLTYFFLSI